MKENFIYKIYEWYISRNLNPENMPKHVAIIMDGNRRYARSKGSKNVLKGHEAGAVVLENIVDWSNKLGIEIITVYAFSTENFNRPKEEVDGLMELFVKYFKRLTTADRIHNNEVKIRVVGKTELLPDEVKKAIKDAEEATAHYNKRLFNIAIGYDGRLEIVDSFKKIAKLVKEGKINPEDIDENTISENLYTSGVDDPNLIIRTSGEERLSGFLLWQSSYSELYFCETLWPDMRRVDYLRAIRSYQERERRFGV